MTKFNWSAITRKYIGAPYKFGSWNIDEGLDCLSFMNLILEDQGYKIDYSFKLNGIGIENYTDLENEDQKNALMKEYVLANTKKFPTKQGRPGDIVFCERNIIGILDANAKVLVCSLDMGVKLLNSVKILGVYKWAK